MTPKRKLPYNLLLACTKMDKFTPGLQRISFLTYINAQEQTN